ncbi:MAG: hypothetical protein ABIQ47_08420 [Tepidiformaceae bacterium]
MDRFAKRNRWVIGIAAIAVVAGIATAGWFITGGSSNADTPVVLYDASAGGTPAQTEFQTANAATAEASRRAGFNVKVPPYLPSGFVVADVTISSRPPAQSTSTLRRILFAVKRGQSTLTVIAVNTPFTFEGDDAAHIISSPAKGANIDKVAGAEIVDYTLLTPTRGYVLTARSSELSEAEAVKVLSSLPMD